MSKKYTIFLCIIYLLTIICTLLTIHALVYWKNKALDYQKQVQQLETQRYILESDCSYFYDYYNTNHQN